MRLRDWIRANNISDAEFGDRIGVDQSSVSRYANGNRMPRRETLARIAEVTGGQVTANDFMVALAGGGDDGPAGSRPAPPVTINDAAE